MKDGKGGGSCATRKSWTPNFGESAPADSKMVVESLKRMTEITGKDAPPQVKSVAADRGFDSATTRNSLDNEGIYNGICPRSPAALKQRLQEEKFVDSQRRRSQTEARRGRDFILSKSGEKHEKGQKRCVIFFDLQTPPGFRKTPSIFVLPGAWGCSDAADGVRPYPAIPTARYRPPPGQ